MRARLSRDPEKYVEDAVRQQCGPQAQRLDQEMRQDMEKHRPQWEVLVRIDAMRREEELAEQERNEAQSQQQDRPRTRGPQREPGMELSR